LRPKRSIYPSAYLGSFDTNYIIFKNVDIFIKDNNLRTEFCKGKIDYSGTFYFFQNENIKANKLFDKHVLKLQR
jgi:YHS domain-containing protein